MTKKMMDIVLRIVVLGGLCLTSLYSYPLFHTLVEIYIVVIAGTIFVLVWNSRKSLNNNYLLFIGISYLFVAIIELLHTLAYKGMGVFQGFDANLPTRLWIAARYMESLSFLIAPFFFRRRLNRNLLFLIYAVATFFLLNSIFYWNIFPDCFIEGIGLTPFKKISEYIIILILSISIGLLLRYRSEFERDVLRMLSVSMFLTILAELSFTFYSSVYGLSNLIGHFFTLISFYLIYRAIIVTGLTRPFDLLFRNFAQSEAALKRVNEELEAIVAERTADLIGLNELLKVEVTELKRTEEALRESEKKVRRKLDAILSPETDIGELELSDIIDSEKVQKLMDEFYRLTNVGIGIIDLHGKVLVGTGWQDICTNFHRVHPESCRLCIESDLELSRNVPADTFRQYRCKNNMWDIATPIMLGDRHMGNIFLGQFLFDDETPDHEVFRQQARRYGFNEEEYLAALDRVPQWSRRKVDAAMSFYAAFAGMIGNLSYSNIKLAGVLEERKRAEEALRESEDRYRTIFQNSPLGIFRTTVDGRFLEANPAAAKLFGYDSPETLIREVHDIGKQLFAHPEDRPKIVSEQIGSPGVTRRVTRYRRKDGRELIANLYLQTIRSAEGQPLFFEGIVEDITDRKRAEEEIRKLNMELEQRVKDRTARLEAANKELEAFAYSVSHDLRAPLRHIDGFLELLQNRTGTIQDEKSRHYMAVITDSAKKMGRLIDDLLSFSRMGRYEMSKVQVDLGALVKEAIREVAPEAEGRTVRWKIGDLPTVSGDQAMLRIVLVNLISNALKFTLPREQADIEIGCQVDEKETIIFIRDNGVGFDMAYVDKLFNVFQRLHHADEFEGTGAGRGRRERSTRAPRFTFPCRKYTKCKKGIPMKTIKRILLAEDDPRDVELTLNALSEYNLANEVAVVRDGVEALDYLYRRETFSSRHEGNPVVILLDLKMPRMDGIQVLKQLKSDERMRLIPVVILTSSREDRDLGECYSLGISAYVVKPVRFTEFVEAVKKIGMFWALINEPPPGSVKKP